MKLPDWNIIVCNKIPGNFCSDFPGNALVRSGLELAGPDWALKFTQPTPASDNGQFGEELFFLHDNLRQNFKNSSAASKGL